MKFRTEIGPTKYPFHVSFSSQIGLMGSCFSDHIGGLLDRSKFQVLNNPMGIVFNPVSIGRQLEYVIGHRKLNPGQLAEHDGLWHHFDFHGRFSSVDKMDTLAKIQNAIELNQRFLAKASVLFITFGTADVFLRNETGEVVANNHKFPIEGFTRKRLTIEEICTGIGNPINVLIKNNPALRIIFTVSPVRYIRNGLQENQRSKATLLMAIDQMQDDQYLFYFPSYEMFVDDLRDYRYYADDLVHPSTVAVEYVWEKFKASFFDKPTTILEQRVDRLLKSIEHRPIHPKSRNHIHFRKKLLEECNSLIGKYPFLDLTQEKKDLSGEM